MGKVTRAWQLTLLNFKASNKRESSSQQTPSMKNILTRYEWFISHISYPILDSYICTCRKVCTCNTYNKLHSPMIHMTPHCKNILGGKLICILFNLELTLNTVIVTRAKIRIKP